MTTYPASAYRALVRQAQNAEHVERLLQQLRAEDLPEPVIDKRGIIKVSK